ncbi:MAG: SRPBCC family protein [Nitrospiraceae bacterium]|nr:SRPBCC family protein [Nitrospiraceae bacterium]
MNELPETFEMNFSRLPGGSFRLTASQILPVAPARAFSFFDDPHNLAYITPEWLEFRLLNDGGGRAFEGVEFKYTIKWLGFRIPWRSLIVDYHPPKEFTDIQIIGPYRKWVHVHTFRPASEGQKTLMKDTVDYRLPLGLAGRFVHIWIVERQLRDIFTYRALRITEWGLNKLSN